MKTLIDDYTFNPITKTVTFTGNAAPTVLEQILLITNVTDGEILYNFADRLRGGVLDQNKLVLTWDTGAMSSTDKLQIFIDSDEYHQNMVIMLEALLKNSFIPRDTADRIRIIMDNNPVLINYMRNSATSLNTTGEVWYSPSSWNIVDDREKISVAYNQASFVAMQRWTR